MSDAGEPLKRRGSGTAGWPAPAWLVAGTLALAVFALALATLPHALAAWLIFGSAVLAFTVYAPTLAFFAFPFVVAFGALAPLDVHGLHAGPVDLVLGGLALAYAVRTLQGMAVPTGEQVSCLRILRAVLPGFGGAGRVGRVGSAVAAPLSSLRRLARREPLRFAVFAAVLAYLAMVALSLVVATSRAATVKEVIKWSEVAALVGLGLWLLRSPRDVRLLAWGMIAAGVAEALVGYGQWALANGSLGTSVSDIRVFGTFGQPNPYAGYLNFSLPLALALVFFGTDARERWVAGAASVLMLGAEMLASSRGGLLGLVAAALVLGVVGWRHEREAALAALVGVPVLLAAWAAHLIPARVQDALVSQFRVGGVSICGEVTARNFSTVERLAHWVAGLRMFQAHPLLGVGAGNYDAVYAHYACADWPESLGHAHNVYINAAAETGILGLLAFLAVIAVALILGWRATHPPSAPADSASAALAGVGQVSQADVPARALSLGFFAVVVALCVHNLTDDLFVHGMALQFALCLACLLRLVECGQPKALN